MASTRRADRKVVGPSVGAAVDAFLATLDNAGTARNYAGTLRALVIQLGADTPLAVLASPLAGAELCSWFERRWGERAAATWNRNLDALRSASRHWADQGWLEADAAQGLRRRKRPPDRTRSLSRAEVQTLLSRADVALRDKTLWRMLYETAARISEVLSLDVADLNLSTHQARVRRKGGAADVIVWQTGTARLLPRLLQGRKAGPVFLTERRARVALPATDLDPVSGRARLSYRRAAEVFEEATGGWALHQLRHSALTHAAEDGANTSTLLAYSVIRTRAKRLQRPLGTIGPAVLERTRISSFRAPTWARLRKPQRRYVGNVKFGASACFTPLKIVLTLESTEA